MPTFQLTGHVPGDPITKIQVVQRCSAYKATSFANPLLTPIINAAAPGPADYGPFNVPASQSAGGDFAFNVSTFEPFMVSYYDPLDTSNSGSWNLYWLGPILPQSPTNVQAFTGAVDRTSARSTGASVIAGASVGATLPAAGGIINVVSTTTANAAFKPTGSILIVTSLGAQLVQYLGTTATTFTGCTGGVGTMTAGSVVQAYQNGPTRRTCYVTVNLQTSAIGNTAILSAKGQAGGVAWTTTPLISASIVQMTAASLNTNMPLVFPVDPGAIYYVGAGSDPNTSVVLLQWNEVDD